MDESEGGGFTSTLVQRCPGEGVLPTVPTRWRAGGQPGQSDASPARTQHFAGCSRRAERKRLPAAPMVGAERRRDLSHESPAEEGPALPGLPSEAAEDRTRESHRQFRSDLSSTL